MKIMNKTLSLNESVPYTGTINSYMNGPYFFC